MSNSKVLPHPRTINTPALFFAFQGKAPEEIRRLAAELTQAGAHKYEDIWAEAVRALGGDSPEGVIEKTRAIYTDALAKLVADGVSTQLGHVLDKENDRTVYYFASSGWFSGAMQFVTFPEGAPMFMSPAMLTTKPSYADLARAHAAAVAIFTAREKESAEKAATAAAVTK